MTRPIRRSAGANALVVSGIVVYFIVIGVYIWMRWDAAAQAGDPGESSQNGAIWGLVIVGGPIALLVAVVVAKLRSRAVSKEADLSTASDDPSKGMTGHD